MRLHAVVLLLALFACKRTAPTPAPVVPEGPSAGDVCRQLEAVGVAHKCQVASRGDLGTIARSASEYVTFGITTTPGKPGKVLRFRNAADFGDAVSGFEAAAFLIGPHRYGSSKALIFVQLPKETSADVGAKASAVVSAL